MGEDDEFNFGSVKFEVSFKHPRGPIRELNKCIVMVSTGEVFKEI